MSVAEIWRGAVGWEGRYEVSSLGRVRSLQFRARGGVERQLDVPRGLTPTPTHDGYSRVRLWLFGTVRARPVHQLVLEAFVGPRPVGHEAAHLDGDSLNNELSNLAWVTVLENNRQKHAHGTMAAGERNGGARLSRAQAEEIRSRYRRGNGAALAVEYGVSKGTICNIARGDTWKARSSP